MNDSKEEVKKYIGDLYKFLKESLSIKEDPRVILSEDEENSKKLEGLTAYYSPEEKSIKLYITNRHFIDILRSFAHEVIHHHQNESGHKMDTSGDIKYAQNNESLRKLEEEAYLKGNMLFRDWKDSKK